MNERFVIQLFKNGTALPIDHLNDQGVLLVGEPDSWPRGLTIEFDGVGDSTKYRMNRVRALKGWEPYQFKFDVGVGNGALVCSGAGKDPRALPAGLYWFRLAIADLVIPSRRVNFEINDNQTTTVRVDVAFDPREVRLKNGGNLATYDPQIVRVISAPASQIDGQGAAAWLQSAVARQDRKACLLNLLAKVRTAPTTANPLIANVQSVFFCHVERIYARVDKAFYDRLQELVKDPEQPFYYEGPPNSPTHQRLLDEIAAKGLEPTTAGYSLLSFRQEGRNSMQAVVAVPPTPDGHYYADLDIDLGNPLQDLDGFFVHMGELVSPDAETDHLALHDALARRDTGPFLYYDVVEAPSA